MTLGRGTGPKASGRPLLCLMGDSYCAGTGLSGRGFFDTARLIAAPRGWRWLNVSLGGTGYLRASEKAGNYLAGQADRAIEAHPYVVVIVGSRNDCREDAKAVAAAADELYDYLATSLPRSRVVVVGPIWPAADVPGNLLEVSATLRVCAAKRQFPFVDALEIGWQAELLKSDGIHLNNRGHRMLAYRISAAIAW